MWAFRRTAEGIATRFDEDESLLLGELAVELASLLEGDAELRRDDPALARLFPDARRDDPAAAEEFRGLVHGELRIGKVDAARTFARTVLEADQHGGRLVLDDETAEEWLRTLNDLRLLLGTRIGVTDDGFEDDLPEDDPRWHARHVYDFLTFVQGSLIEALAGP